MATRKRRPASESRATPPKAERKATRTPAEDREKTPPASPVFDTVVLEGLRCDPALQPRVELDDKTINEYREAIERGEELPPPVVFNDGTDYWLADGNLRLKAREAAGQEKFKVQVRAGNKRDAQLHALGANKTHGKRLTNADKRRAVGILLADDEWSTWSDSAIAAHVGCSHMTVAKIRKLTGRDPEKRKGRDGRARKRPQQRGAAKSQTERLQVDACDTDMEPQVFGLLPAGSTGAAATAGPSPSSSADPETGHGPANAGSAGAPSAKVEPGTAEDAAPLPDESELDVLEPEVLEARRDLEFAAERVREAQSLWLQLYQRRVPALDLMAVHAEEVAAAFEKLLAALRSVTPARVCPDCEGSGRWSCFCMGGGWVFDGCWTATASGA